MFQQGDQERALRLPVSPLMDRSKSGITKSQGEGSLLCSVPGQAAHSTAADAPWQVSCHIRCRVSAAACTAPYYALPAALQIAAHHQFVRANQACN